MEPTAELCLHPLGCVPIQNTSVLGFIPKTQLQTGQVGLCIGTHGCLPLQISTAGGASPSLMAPQQRTHYEINENPQEGHVQPDSAMPYEPPPGGGETGTPGPISRVTLYTTGRVIKIDSLRLFRRNGTVIREPEGNGFIFGADQTCCNDPKKIQTVHPLPAYEKDRRVDAIWTDSGATKSPGETYARVGVGVEMVRDTDIAYIEIAAFQERGSHSPPVGLHVWVQNKDESYVRNFVVSRHAQKGTRQGATDNIYTIHL